MSAPYYVDVHTHLTHQRFDGKREEVIARAVASGLGAIVVNGLEPTSNREILAMAERHAAIVPALGIYPLDAVNGLLPSDFEIKVASFDVDEEIAFIKAQVASGKVAAVGECGLDGYWIKDETFPEQERVFTALIDVAMSADLPLIIHTRKRERRAMEILAHHGARKVNFHCFGGKVKDARQAAERHGWYFSIPANARVNESFTRMLQTLPSELILTETDAPFLAPQRGTRNEPANVVGTIAYWAELQGWTIEHAKEVVYTNYQHLFAKANL